MDHSIIAEKFSSLVVMVFATGALVGSLLSILSLVVLDWMKESKRANAERITKVSIVG